MSKKRHFVGLMDGYLPYKKVAFLESGGAPSFMGNPTNIKGKRAIHGS